MQEYEMTLGTHKRALDPELKPFMKNRNDLLVLFLGTVGIPIILAAILLGSLLLADQQVIFSLIAVIGFLSLILSLLTIRKSYRSLSNFQISSSIFNDLSRLLELFGIRVQAALFPILILLFMVSFITGNNEERSANFVTVVIQLVSLVLIFVSVLFILNTFLNQKDSYNNRVMALDARTIDEDLRNSLKDLGSKLGYNNVKIRLADIRPNYFGKLAIGAVLNNIVYLAYSKIAKYQADNDQSFTYCSREICYLSLEDRKLFHVISAIHNFLFIMYLGLAGFYLYSFSSEVTLIEEAMGFFCIAMIIVYLTADAFLKAYLSSFDLLLELRADRKTITVLKEMNYSEENIKRNLRLTEKVDPLSSNFPGFRYRRNVLLPDSDQKNYWDEL